MEEKLQKLAEAGIQALPVDLPSHIIFERDGFVALVERRDDSFGGIGAAGLLTASGVAPLVWRSERAVFVTKGSAQDATAEQVEQLRRFQTDLENALR